MRTASLSFPLLLLIIGAVWFLKATDILPATTTLIALGLAVAGAAVLVADGFNKQSVVAGPMLIYAGAALYARSEYLLATSPLLALGLMLLGGLMLLSRSDLVPHKHNRRQQRQQP